LPRGGRSSAGCGGRRDQKYDVRKIIIHLLVEGYYIFVSFTKLLA
jgi:hypothetical protein